jgi:hypothetical protein
MHRQQPPVPTEAVTEIGKRVQAKAGAYAIVVVWAAMPPTPFEPSGSACDRVRTATISLETALAGIDHIEISRTPVFSGTSTAFGGWILRSPGVRRHVTGATAPEFDRLAGLLARAI